jgi:hypothetical protein
VPGNTSDCCAGASSIGCSGSWSWSNSIAASELGKSIGSDMVGYSASILVFSQIELQGSEDQELDGEAKMRAGERVEHDVKGPNEGRAWNVAHATLVCARGVI